MNRAKVICHMLTSIDGKISGNAFRLPETAQAARVYQELHKKLGGDGVAYGRTTVSEVFTKGKTPDLSAFQDASLPRTDFITGRRGDYRLVSIDPEGGLGWSGPTVSGRGPGYDGARIIEILLESVSDAYLAYLRSLGISYLFCGKETPDCTLMAEKLYRLFGIKTLLLQGGGITNGAFAQAGLIDEISLVIAPVLSAGSGVPDLAGVPGAHVDPQAYTLQSVRSQPDGSLWLHYVRDTDA